MSVLNSAGFYTAGPGDSCDRGPVVIDYAAAQRIQQTITRVLAQGPVGVYVCSADGHPRFATEQRALEPHVCPICEGPMKRCRALELR